MADAVARLSAALADRYRIERELGQGGMATVYLAEDVRHHRKVAIKVLHPELSAVLGTERFLKEIELTASLQHPHILPLFDSGAADGLLYYVMPFVEGESLRGRLTRDKQLPIADAVRIASDVAAALEYAHKRGVVHRDIKPENILLHDGRPVVADFGIALAVAQAGGSRMTQTGLSLGTPQYMSPEQAMGERELSPRSDLYALGCVTYEMLTGEPPFSGATAQAIVARVLTEAPRPIILQRHTVPEHVEAAVLTALEKLPADRWASAKEYADSLAGGQAVRRTAGRITAAGAAVTQSRRRAALLPWVLVAALAGLAGWALLLRKPATHSAPFISYSLTPPEEIRLLDIGGSPAVISPDGSTLVFEGRPVQKVVGHQPMLLLWSLAGGLPTELVGTENGTWPFFSPDGANLAFVANGQLKRIPLEGGPVSIIGDAGPAAGSFRGGTWTERGEILFGTSTGLRRIRADGGSSEPVAVHFATGDSVARHAILFPSALPGGEAVLASVATPTTSRPPELVYIALKTGLMTLLGQVGTSPRYLAPRSLLFMGNDASLRVAPFDAGAKRLSGPSRPVPASVVQGTAGLGKFDVAANGTLVYFEGLVQEQRRLLRVDRRGTIKALDAPPRNYNGPRFSPDGKRIAVAIGPVPNPPMDIWLYDLGVGTLTQLTFDSTSVHPEWSADGKRLLHRSARGTFRIASEAPDRSAPTDSLYGTPNDLWEVVPSRTGDTLLVRQISAETDRDILMVPLKPAGPVVPFAAGPRIQAEPALSPDGKWLAYSSDETGNFEVYVRAFPGPGPRYQVSVGGGTSARWNPRGGEIFVLSRDSLVAVPVRAVGNTLELGRGKGLFANSFAPLNYHQPYDVAPDGSWFVFVGGTGTSFSGSLRVMLNWFDQPEPRK